MTLSAEDIQTLVRAVNYLESATDILEENGEDEEDISDSREMVEDARLILDKLQGGPRCKYCNTSIAVSVNLPQRRVCDVHEEIYRMDAEETVE